MVIFSCMLQEHAPCVLFIDEIDAICPKRETAQREMERRIVTQLLACLDGVWRMGGEGGREERREQGERREERGERRGERGEEREEREERGKERGEGGKRREGKGERRGKERGEEREEGESRRREREKVEKRGGGL